MIKNDLLFTMNRGFAIKDDDQQTTRDDSGGTPHERKFIMSEKRKVKEIVMSAVPLVLSVFLTVGVKFVFHACGSKADGSFMNCHKAEQIVFITGCVLTVMSVLLLVLKNAKVRKVLAVAMIPVSIVTALIPNTIIKLCMMNDMRCHTVMKPAVIIISVVIAAYSLIYVIVNRNEE